MQLLGPVKVKIDHTRQSDQEKISLVLKINLDHTQELLEEIVRVD